MTIIAIPQPPPPPHITKFAMVSRLTDEEYVTILSASKTDVGVEAWINKLNMARYIDLADERTILGLQFLVSKNLLTEQRVQEILNAPVLESERA